MTESNYTGQLSTAELLRMLSDRQARQFHLFIFRTTFVPGSPYNTKIYMQRCKITILKTTLNEELAKEYAAPGFTKCPMMKEGQIFYADYARPEGFCDEAWKAVYQYVFALSHGAGLFYYGDWINKEGVAICSCNDGLRPVIMKIERTDETSVINYEPVR